MKRQRFALNESLKLDGTTIIPGSVVQYLACHQLEGIRSIHRGLAQHTGVILNDESGLGKIHQVIGYLSATIGPTDKVLVVSNNIDRIHHWLYHLELLTDLRTVILTESETSSLNYQILLTEFATITKQMVSEIEVQLVIIDETRMVDVDLYLAWIFSKLSNTKRIFLYSSDLLDDLHRLLARLKLCQFNYFGSVLDDFAGDVHRFEQKESLKKLKLFFLTRSVLIRRLCRHNYDIIPLVDNREFADRFESWKVVNGLQGQSKLNSGSCHYAQKGCVAVAKSSSDELFDFINQTAQESSLNKAIVGDLEIINFESDSEENDTVAFAVERTQSEPLFDIENNTEDMPKLEISDSESKSTDDVLSKIFVTDILSLPLKENIEIPETERSSQVAGNHTDSEEYLELGQALVCGNSNSRSSADTIIMKSPPFVEEKYYFTIDRPLRRNTPSSSSNDVEIVSKEVTNAIVVSSSSNSDKRVGREKSPDLFSDTDDESNKTIKMNSQDSFLDLLLKSPVVFDRIIKTKPSTTRPKLVQSNVSTPISKLMHAQIQDESPDEESLDDIFADQSTFKQTVSPNRTENVFEITDNDAFGKRVRVCAERKSMSPIDKDLGVQFVAEEQPYNSPIEIVDSQTENCNSKSQNKHPVDLKKATPKSEGTSAKRLGWLSKGRNNASPGGGSPKTPTARKKISSPGFGINRSSERVSNTTSLKRKKLEDLFRASTSVNRRKSAPVTSSAKKSSPKKKCFQQRLIERYNQILVSPSGFDSDFE
ncbi:uncharacterized protein LOC129724694 isoform X2 [Wyeomyia smithii]|uniref:uncharacterized protein LOC129724694 isoform X2 n=1 Tax=Wyeomyia smithii TaxID=174621 RepID=UPI002467B9D4|nr:uncharacterized protein LOC129724694 isoform X2 [Wyeomyia smithii]